MIYFSETTGGFYDDSYMPMYESNGSWPSDLVKVTNEEKNNLILGLTENKEIGVIDGKAVLVSITPSSERSLKLEQCWVVGQMKIADIEVNKHQDGDARAIATEAAWRAYRCQLRDYVKGGQIVGERPKMPV